MAGVVVVGSINTDYVVRVERRPLPGESVADAALEIHPGGKGANQAVAVARSGVEVQLVGAVGDDAAGTRRLEQLVSEGVRLDGVVRRSGIATGSAFITLTPDGENSIIVAPGANATLAPEDVDAARGLIGAASVVAAQLEVPAGAVARAFAHAVPGAERVLNAAPAIGVPDEVIAAADVIIVNELEAAALGTSAPHSPEAALRAAGALRRRAGQLVVITLGASGAVAVGRGLHLHVPARSIAVVDTTGAGDAFVGALCAALERRAALSDALGFAVSAGSATAAALGAEPQIGQRID